MRVINKIWKNKTAFNGEFMCALLQKRTWYHQTLKRYRATVNHILFKHSLTQEIKRYVYQILIQYIYLSVALHLFHGLRFFISVLSCCFSSDTHHNYFKLRSINWERWSFFTFFLFLYSLLRIYFFAPVLALVCTHTSYRIAMILYNTLFKLSSFFFQFGKLSYSLVFLVMAMLSSVRTVWAPTTKMLLVTQNEKQAHGRRKQTRNKHRKQVENATVQQWKATWKAHAK